MQKTFTSLLVFVLCGIHFNMAAQEHSTASNDIIENISVGANLGFSIPSMRYSGDMYDPYDSSPLFSGLGGIFANWNFYGNLSLRPHLNFTGRGGRMQYDPFFIDYKLRSTYFDFRIPVIYTFNINSKFEPYVALGPSLNFAVGGKSAYTSGENKKEAYKLKLSKSNYKGFDFGAFMGAGVNYPITIYGYQMTVGAEIGYYLGMMDTFSKAEIDHSSTAINLPEYRVDGTRKNSNLSIAFNVSIPLKSLFAKKKRAKKQPVQAPVAYVAPTMQERKVTVQEKQCCSLDEMYDLILNGQDISTKKICAFDDITFDFDKASIRPESEEYLDKFVTILKKFPTLHLSIIGHTDNVGDNQYNMQLSKKRAEAVADYFMANGIDQSRLRCYGYGSRQPLTDNSTSQARALNRRVEFDIIEGSF